MVRGIMVNNKVIVIYDGECVFCRSQIKLLGVLDVWGILKFESLHDPEVKKYVPGISYEELLKRMYVVTPSSEVYGGADAVKCLSRKLMLLWPLAILLHVPCSSWLWNALYDFVAKNRYKIAGRCGGSCGFKR